MAFIVYSNGWLELKILVVFAKAKIRRISHDHRASYWYLIVLVVGNPAVQNMLPPAQYTLEMSRSSYLTLLYNMIHTGLVFIIRIFKEKKKTMHMLKGWFIKKKIKKKLIWGNKSCRFQYFYNSLSKLFFKSGINQQKKLYLPLITEAQEVWR